MTCKHACTQRYELPYVVAQRACGAWTAGLLDESNSVVMLEAALTVSDEVRVTFPR